MATHTVSLPPSTPEPVEKEACEEVKTMDQGGVSAPKESEEKPKDAKSLTPEAPQAELAEKIEVKQSEPPAVEEVTKSNEEERPNAEDSPTVEEVTEEDVVEKPKAEDSPTVEEVKKEYVVEKPKDVDSPNGKVVSAEPEEEVKDDCSIQTPDDTPVVDASPKDNPDLKGEEISNNAEPVVENVESKSQEQIETKFPEKPTEEQQVETKSAEKPTEESTKETAEEKTEEPKQIDVIESLVDAVAKEEEKPEAAVVKDAEPLEEKQETEEEKPIVPPTITNGTEKEPVVLEPKKVEGEVAKLEAPSDETKDSKPMNENTAVKAKVLEPVPAEATECVETKDKESIDVVEEPLNKKTEMETGVRELKTEEKEEKMEEPAQTETIVKTEEDKTEKSEVSVLPEKIVETQEGKGENTKEFTKPATELAAEVTSLAEKPAEATTRDIHFFSENGTTKDEAVLPTETSKEGVVEKKVDEGIATTPTSVPLGELLKPETEPKEVENVEAVKSLDEKETAADETAKPDIQSMESTKDIADENKTSSDTPKEEVASKTKQSNNLLIKMKRSLVKAKKAILGKSPNTDVKT